MSLNSLFTPSANGSKPGYNIYCQDLGVYGNTNFSADIEAQDIEAQDINCRDLNATRDITAVRNITADIVTAEAFDATVLVEASNVEVQDRLALHDEAIVAFNMNNYTHNGIVETFTMTSNSGAGTYLNAGSPLVLTCQGFKIGPVVTLCFQTWSIPPSDQNEPGFIIFPADSIPLKYQDPNGGQHEFPIWLIPDDNTIKPAWGNVIIRSNGSVYIRFKINIPANETTDQNNSDFPSTGDRATQSANKFCCTYVI